MVEPQTAAVIVSLFFSEAIKESGKALGKGVGNTFALLVNAVREKLAEGTEGLLIQGKTNQQKQIKLRLQDELQTQMDVELGFAYKLKEIVEQLQAQDERVRQVVLSEIELSGDLKGKDISQKAMRGNSAEQEMLKHVKAQNIELAT